MSILEQENITILRKKCGTMKCSSSPKVCQKLIVKASPVLRSFPIEIRKAPTEKNAIFVCNHSNTHDVFVAMEVIARLKRSFVGLAAWDGLNIVSRIAFAMGNTVFVKRFSKESRVAGLEKLCAHILHGENGVIFPESTWNLHPTWPMQKLNAGFLRAALVTSVPVIPMILEYIEAPKVCKKEAELYSRCVVTFGEPIYPSMDRDLFEQADAVRTMMSDMRKALWVEFGIHRDSLDEINRELYLNHLDMKKNHAFGFKYDTVAESHFLLGRENEYCINQQGEFVPACLE